MRWEDKRILDWEDEKVAGIEEGFEKTDEGVVDRKAREELT